MWALLHLCSSSWTWICSNNISRYLVLISSLDRSMVASLSAQTQLSVPVSQAETVSRVSRSLALSLSIPIRYRTPENALISLSQIKLAKFSLSLSIDQYWSARFRKAPFVSTDVSSFKFFLSCLLKNLFYFKFIWIGRKLPRTQENAGKKKYLTTLALFKAMAMVNRQPLWTQRSSESSIAIKSG